MSLAIFSPTPYINKWQMSLCNNSSDTKSYWIHRVDVKVSAQVTTVTYMHQSQPSLHSLRKHFTVHLELWPGNHLIWCNATFIVPINWQLTNVAGRLHLFCTYSLESTSPATEPFDAIHLVYSRISFYDFSWFTIHIKYIWPIPQ